MVNYLNLQKNILKKLLDNIYFSKKKGMIIAAPSDDPPYKFHWIRDSSLVMKAVIDVYSKTKSMEYFILIINYLENELSIQNLNTMTGLGEPKINIDGSPYNEPWGRPQNDGPALRGLNMIKIYHLLKNDYPNIVNLLVKKILINDIKYVTENYKKPCFDLWEEIIGWHFYTRIVQFKFIKEFIKLNNQNYIYDSNTDLNQIHNYYLQNIKHHISKDTIISSFDKDGNIIRWDDASILLGLSHVDYDKDVFNIFGINRFNSVAKNLIKYFNEKYDKSLNLIGRYKNDAYYNGEAWIICSLALCQFYMKINELNNKDFQEEYRLAVKLFMYIINIDQKLDLAEQYNPVTNKQKSAITLTWNYTELYFSIKYLINI
jgi:glucoamylase